MTNKEKKAYNKAIKDVLKYQVNYGWTSTKYKVVSVYDINKLIKKDK